MTPGHARQIQTMTYAEYLAAEEVAEVRHEFLRGEVWAMSGGTIEHSALAASVIRELGTALSGRPCRVLTSDARVRIPETEYATYPDVSVVCGRVETASEDRHGMLNPIILVEVLSDSTEGYDRGAKFAHYRRIDSLQAYVLVSQDEPHIEVYRRTDDGWVLTEARSGGQVELLEQDGLHRLAVVLDVDTVYANPLEA